MLLHAKSLLSISAYLELLREHNDIDPQVVFPAFIYTGSTAGAMCGALKQGINHLRGRLFHDVCPRSPAWHGW